jgi:putative tricarboxylic transport membrane protein
MPTNFKIGLFATIVGGIYFIMAIRIPIAAIGDPMGPKYFPIGLGAIMLIAGVVLLIKGYLEHAAVPGKMETKSK